MINLCAYICGAGPAVKYASLIFWIVGGISVIGVIAICAFVGFVIFMREILGVGEI